MDDGIPPQVIAAWLHQGAPAQLVRELKYGRATAVVTQLADAMVAVAPEADLVTWVPASPGRRRRRGFDQGELLARSVARRLDLPVKRLLRRRDREPQTARDLTGRLRGPVLVGAGSRLRNAPRVLVVDDVVTTGSTQRAAARVLHGRGAGLVVGLVATAVSAHP